MSHLMCLDMPLFSTQKVDSSSMKMCRNSRSQLKTSLIWGKCPFLASFLASFDFLIAIYDLFFREKGGLVSNDVIQAAFLLLSNLTLVSMDEFVVNLFTFLQNMNSLLIFSTTSPPSRSLSMWKEPGLCGPTRSTLASTHISLLGTLSVIKRKEKKW